MWQITTQNEEIDWNNDCEEIDHDAIRNVRQRRRLQVI